MYVPELMRSARARRTPPSPIRRLAHLANAAQDRGREVFYLNIGQPDVPSPPEFLEGLRTYTDDVVAYQSSGGSPRLREAWSAYMNRTLDLSTAPDELLITVGASEALIFTFMICCNPGDEVLVFDPTYANYIGFAAITGVNLVPVLSRLDDGFALPSEDMIADRLSPHTRAILLCNPNNPTGTVYDDEQVRTLLRLCEEMNLFLIVDETYREIVFDGRTPRSVLQLEQSERVIVIDSLSKRFSLCGARVGALLTPNEQFRSQALNLAQARLAAPSPEQHAAAHMLETVDPSYVTEMTAIYQSRRDVAYRMLREIPGVETHLPSGAFYTIARLPVDDTDDFASFLLSDFEHDGDTVFVAPASGFYMGFRRGHNKIRVAYVLNDEKTERAIRALGAGLEAYRSR